MLTLGPIHPAHNTVYRPEVGLIRVRCLLGCTLRTRDIEAATNENFRDSRLWHFLIDDLQCRWRSHLPAVPECLAPGMRRCLAFRLNLLSIFRRTLSLISGFVERLTLRLASAVCLSALPELHVRLTAPSSAGMTVGAARLCMQLQNRSVMCIPMHASEKQIPPLRCGMRTKKIRVLEATCCSLPRRTSAVLLPGRMRRASPARCCVRCPPQDSPVQPALPPPRTVSASRTAAV